MAVSLHLLQGSLQWLHNPLARIAVLCILGVICVLAFSYFATRQWL
jgi:hypothetical protein